MDTKSRILSVLMSSLRWVAAASFSWIFLTSGYSAASAAEPLRLKKGSRVVLLGNGLGSRMMSFGHFETEIHRRHGDKRLFIRNMCDEGNTPGFRPHSGRPSPWAFPGAESFYPSRSEAKDRWGSGHTGVGDYDSPDAWLSRLEPDVVVVRPPPEWIQMQRELGLDTEVLWRMLRLMPGRRIAGREWVKFMAEVFVDMDFERHLGAPNIFLSSSPQHHARRAHGRRARRSSGRSRRLAHGGVESETTAKEGERPLPRRRVQPFAAAASGPPKRRAYQLECQVSQESSGVDGHGALQASGHTVAEDGRAAHEQRT